uniref:Uncharacterized protein n=1 Tax=Lygus hesperus TaxID=30085 RepID=A0A0K8T8Q7_LYGHE
MATAQQRVSKPTTTGTGVSQIQTITPNKPELTVLGKIEQSGDILSAHYSADGNDIFAGSINGEVFHFESRSLKKLNQVEDEEMKNKHSPITSVVPVKINNENKLFTSHVSGWVKIWDAGGNTCLSTVKEKNQILGVIPHTRKEKFLTLGEDAKMRLYDMKTGQLAMTFENSYTKDKMTGHDSKIFAAKFHPKNINEFISGGWDDTVQFWDMRKGQSIRYFAGAHICGEGLDLDIHGELVLTCAYQPSNTCRLWNYATAQPYLVLGAETAKLYCGKYLGPKFVVTGSSDPGNVRIINLFNMATVVVHKTGAVGVYCVDAHQRGGDKKENVVNTRLLLAAGETLSEIDFKFLHQ